MAPPAASNADAAPGRPLTACFDGLPERNSALSLPSGLTMPDEGRHHRRAAIPQTLPRGLPFPVEPAQHFQLLRVFRHGSQGKHLQA